MKKYFFLLVLIISTEQTSGQSAHLDSLISSLSVSEVQDSTYVDLLNEIAFQLSMTDQKQSIQYINQSIATAKAIGYEQGLIRATTIKGSSFLVIGLPDQALSYYLEALTYDVSKYPLEHIKLNNNIGEIYRRKEVYDSSLSYFNRALTIASENEQYYPVIIYNNLGEVSLMQGNVEMAEMHFKNCLENAQRTNHLRGIGYGYFGLAQCAYLAGEKKRAVLLMKKSIESRKIADHKRGLIQSYLQIGAYYAEEKNATDSALFYWEKGETLAKSFKANDLLNNAYERLYSFYLDNNQIKKAAFYLEQHKYLGDSIRNAEFISNVRKMESALQSELVLTENELLRQEQQQRESQERARLTLILMLILITAVIGYTIFQYRRKQFKINEANRETLFSASLLSLSKELNRDDFQLDTFINHLLELSRNVINCDRGTFWRYNEANESVKLEAIKADQHAISTPNSEIFLRDFPQFFDDLINQRATAVNKASDDARLQDIYEQYFKSLGIESILNAPIMVDGNFTGLLSFTMVNERVRHWSVNEEKYVGSLVDLIVTALSKVKRNSLEIEKEELIEKLKSRNKSLLEFNSVISHNLREPLTQIIGFSYLLKADEDFDLTKDIIEKIGIASNRIDTVVKELSTVLNVSDPTAADYNEITLTQLIAEVKDLLKVEIQEKQALIQEELKLETTKSYMPFLSDILYHLLSNSLKYADNKRALEITISSQEDETHEFITVRDNGRGIDLDKFGNKLFKMYQRYHLDVEGRGIGLFIVKSRADSLNGSVRLFSEERKGTTVTLEFPKVGPSLDNSESIH